MKPLVVVGLILAAIASGPVAIGADTGPDRAEIDGAIARGLNYLRGEQGTGGEWTYSFNHDHELGITALAALALLENGAETSDPGIVKAVGVVRALAERSDQTYDLSLAVLFLARAQKLQSGPNDALIRRLAGRLAGGNDNGMWTYQVPLRDDEGTRGGTSSRRKRRFVTEVGDNSNTQFALLGVWAAGRHGFDPNETLAAIDGHFRSTQDSRGHWGYVPGERAGVLACCPRRC